MGAFYGRKSLSRYDCRIKYMVTQNIYKKWIGGKRIEGKR